MLLADARRSRYAFFQWQRYRTPTSLLITRCNYSPRLVAITQCSLHSSARLCFPHTSRSLASLRHITLSRACFLLPRLCLPLASVPQPSSSRLPRPCSLIALAFAGSPPPPSPASHRLPRVRSSSHYPAPLRAPNPMRRGALALDSRIVCLLSDHPLTTQLRSACVATRRLSC